MAAPDLAGWKSDFSRELLGTGRTGVDRLLAYLEWETDFFTAPASTKYHGSYEGGLVKHSLDVYRWLVRFGALVTSRMDGVPFNSMALASLLHDICKANFYEMATRNVKNAAGVWEQVSYYSINDQFPVGHGEKSAMIAQRFISLTDEELAAIRWHMAGFTGDSDRVILSAALAKWPLVAAVHIADLSATYLADE